MSKSVFVELEEQVKDIEEGLGVCWVGDESGFHALDNKESEDDTA